MNALSDYPDYLSSFDSLEQHFRAQLEGLNTTEKGKRFAYFVQKLVPQTDYGASFDLPSLSGKISGDGGVDLTANSKIDDSRLVIQSKLLVDRADTIENVITKFQAFTATTGIKQFDLFNSNEPKTNFLLATLSPLSGVLKQYRKSQFAAKAFFEQCEQENRIRFIDGHEILHLLQTAYRKLNHVPMDLVLNFDSPYIQVDNVYIGVVSSVE